MTTYEIWLWDNDTTQWQLVKHEIMFQMCYSWEASAAYIRVWNATGAHCRTVNSAFDDHWFDFSLSESAMQQYLPSQEFPFRPWDIFGADIVNWGRCQKLNIVPRSCTGINSALSQDMAYVNLTRPTLERRQTLGRLRSIYPDMINHFASQSKTC